MNFPKERCAIILYIIFYLKYKVITSEMFSSSPSNTSSLSRYKAVLYDLKHSEFCLKLGKGDLSRWNGLLIYSGSESTLNFLELVSKFFPF